jgi:putative ABC transport system permease protein
MRTLFSRLLELVSRGSREQRINDEIRAHLDLLTDEYVAGGLSRDDARLAARKQFGNVDSARMTHRDQRGFAWVETLAQDVRFAFRILTRERSFALTAIAVLGVGIGVNNMFFTVVYAFKYRGLPIAHAERILAIAASDDRVPQRPLTLNEFHELRDSITTLDALAAHTSAPVTIADDGRAPDRFDGAYVSAGAFEQLGIAPLIGTLPSVDHDRAGASPLVMLGADAWTSRYGGDRSILGRTIRLNGAPATVVAILPERSGFPNTADVWMPLGQWPGFQQSPATRALQVFGRLRDTAGEGGARAEIERVFARLESTSPETNRTIRARVMPINLRLLGPIDGWEPFIMAGIIVLLVASANAANLMIARSMHRSPEIAIRTSLGASRFRIVRQLLVEAAVLATCGAVIGAGFSIAGVAMFESAIPAGTLPYWFDLSMDARVVAALIGITVLTIAIFGLVPALQASRTDVNSTLKDGGRNARGQRRSGAWTAVFLTVELALAMIMLSQIAVVTLRTNADIPTDAASRTRAVMTATITLPAANFPTPERRNDFFRRLQERLEARQEVVAVSRATIMPGQGVAGLRRVEVEGRDSAEGRERPPSLGIEIAAGYLDALGVSTISGRALNEADGNTGADAALVNQRFVEVALAGVEPIGTRIGVAAPGAAPDATVQWRTIVGVVPNIRQQGAGGVDQQTPSVYLPIDASSPATSILMVRHSTDPERIARLLREEALAVDSNVPLYRLSTLEQAVRDAQWNQTVSAYLAVTVSILSVLLAVVGLYAVTAQRITLKTREIGLRMALGAASAQVIRLVLRDLRLPLLLGLVAGTLGAVAWDRAFSSGSRDLYASAPATVITVASLLLAIVIVSCFIPVRRAIRMNPVTALRHD